MLAAALLGVLAVLLAWPVPLLLAGAQWTRRSPAAALVLWQAIAIAGGLSMIGALVTLGLAPYGDHLVAGVVGLAAGTMSPDFWHVLALCGAVLLTAHLLLNLVLTIIRSERQRRRHAQLLMLLSTPAADGSRVIDSPAPVAYCLPGALSSVTVVSAGLIELLDEREMLAVIEHEKAHVLQRHDIVLVLFRAWATSLPWFPIATRAQHEVGLLVELLADDHARRSVDDATLADTIAKVGAGHGASDAFATRLARLGPDTRPLSRGREALAVAAAVALLAVPPALLFAPALADLVNRSA
jgi:Zn-dependent protease with chaperone function